MKERKWEPDNFELQRTSVWSFPDRGSWATHDSTYRGNWSPYVPRNVILRYSDAHDLVLDPFVGGGTTMIEARLLNRNVLGVDINHNSIKKCIEKCSFVRENCGKAYFRVADARNLSFIPNEAIDLFCTHPPYANIIRYSVDIEGDLSRLPVEQFLHEMKTVASECNRVLKRNHFCALLMGDIRQHGNVFPLGFRVMDIFQKSGFKIKEIILKEQYNCRSTDKWTTRASESGFLLLAHEYLFIFVK